MINSIAIRFWLGDDLWDRTDCVVGNTAVGRVGGSRSSRFMGLLSFASVCCDNLPPECRQWLGGLNPSVDMLACQDLFRRGFGVWSIGRRLVVDCIWNVMTRAETTFRLSAKRTRSFKSVGASVQSTTGSRGVRISVSNGRYTMFRGSVKVTVYPLHSPVSSSLPLHCVTVCHHISTGL